MTITSDARIRHVEWADLIKLRRLDIARELTLSLPWLVGSLVFAHYRIFPVALAFSFVFFLTSLPAFVLRYHTGAMAVGQCLTSFFAVWTVHHHCDRGTVARTLRSRFKSFMTCSMFFHLEHHLFPRVPTSRLSALAQRLDRAAPGLSGRRVF